MDCTYQDREEFEDDLYQEDEEDSEGSEANSELEFHLYSQLHYSSNAGEMEEQVEEQAEAEDSRQLGVTEITTDVNGEQEHSGESGPPSPSINKSQQHQKKKKKGEKSDKHKKGKSVLKGQESSSSVFEEVIVIDSSPDVISISESNTSCDDDGVCALKGKDSRQHQTSTPAQQGTQQRKRDFTLPVTVDSSSSESDSESKSESDFSDSSESSDSDGLENWMILGRGNREEDRSISLNLEGGTDINADNENEESSWMVSDKDKEAQIYNKDRGARIAVQRVSNRYYTSKNVQCRNCNKNGHLSKNCLEPKKLSPCFLCGTPGHLVSECPNKHCNNCGLPGHLSDSCSERAYWHKQCHRCSMTGHFFDACPEIWRQYHITTKAGVPVRQQREDHGRTPAYCYNCSRRGHFGHACARHRMFNGTYPTTPFLNHYDTLEDINRRQHRIKMKVKELRNNGLLLTSAQTPLTPGPPKKKQKFSHHKNNQFNQTPRQSPVNHKPSPGHIFFKDDDDYRAKTPKTKKYKLYGQQGSGSNVKPWKPKRPVPASREQPTKLILDEADDFPRGGGKGKSEEVKKKRNKRKLKRGPSVPPVGPKDSRQDNLWRIVNGEMQGAGSKPVKRRRKRKNSAQTITAKKMYPTDENLFIIKQRKRNR